MRLRNWTVAAAAAAGLVTALSTPVAADEPARADKAARTVPWSASLGTASASGERWTESKRPAALPDLVLSGTLTNTGEGCYSVWTKFRFDFVQGPVRKHAEVCGPGTADVDVRQVYNYTTTGELAVCRGTEDTSDCGDWESITWWPIESG